MDDLKRLEKLEELILELQQMSDKGALIIVEGKKGQESPEGIGNYRCHHVGYKKVNSCVL